FRARSTVIPKDSRSPCTPKKGRRGGSTVRSPAEAAGEEAGRRTGWRNIFVAPPRTIGIPIFACPDIRGASQKTIAHSGDLDSGVDGRRAGCETEIAGRGVYKIGIRGEIVATHQCALQASDIHDIPAGIIERNVIYDFGITSCSINNSGAA